MMNNPNENNGTVRRHEPLSRMLMLYVILGSALLINIVPVDFGHSAGDVANNTADKTNLAEVNRFEAGAFENPRNCVGCHRDIYAAWSQSMHRFAWGNAFYQPDYLQASEDTGGLTNIFCGECHTPTGVRTGQLPPPDGSLMDDTSVQGVSCDYCHTVQEVVEPVNVRTISDPGRVKRGPRGDGRSPYHQVLYSEIHTREAFCGACHNVIHPTSGTVVIDTYNDWQGGPYAAQGIRCQDCHMTPGPGVEKNPGKSSPLGQTRDHVATHSFSGGSVFFHEQFGNDKGAELARQMLTAAAELEIEFTRSENGVELLTRIKNVGAGHKIPTGVTYIRKMWLEVTAVNAAGEVLYRSGHIVEGNHVDPEAVLYQKMFRDAQGNLTSKSWLAEEIAYDRRIPAQGYDEQVFQIPTGPGDDQAHISVRLLYRSMSQEFANKLGILGIEVPAIEMTRAEVTVN